MATLVIIRGLPGCGKGAVARAWVAEDPAGRARVSRNHLRRMLHNRRQVPEATEAVVIAARDATIRALLAAGIDVISDDTNLRPAIVGELVDLAAGIGARVVVQDMTNVPLAECLDGNKSSSNRVRAEVIRTMHARYVRGRGYPLPVPDPTTSIAEGPSS